MKKFIVLCIMVVLSGCAAPGGAGKSLATVETSTYLRAERWLPRTFVQVQRAVAQHQAACHINMKFAVDEMHPSYARVFMALDPKSEQKDEDLSHGMVLGLQSLEGKPARGRLYSYYTPTAAQIQQMFDAILHPELCPGDPRPSKPVNENEE